MKQPSIQISGLSVNYDTQRVLTNVYMSLEPGRLYGVIGPNGAGKSTLFKSILGLTPITSGQITIFGDEIDSHRSDIAYVPQRDEIDWSFPANVMDVVLMGRYPHRTIWQRITKEDRQIARHAIDKVHMGHYVNRQIGRLSGGQQQRVFLARALCQQAQILLLDEPFVGVDLTTEGHIIQILKEEAQRGKTLLVVHHDLSSVRSYFSDVIMINQRLIGYGPVDELFTDDMIAQTYGAQLDILHQSGLPKK